MSGLAQLLNTARSALLAQQYGMSVTSHNIANAATPGYSRQRALMVPSMPVRTSAGLIGTGVMMMGVTRIRDQFLDQQIRGSYQTMGAATAEQGVLQHIEALLNEPSTGGMGEVLNRFFAAWQDLSADPEGAVAREQVRQEGNFLAGAFRSMRSELTALRSSVHDNLTATVDRINTLAREISEVNAQIISASSSGEEVPDLRDLRDAKLEELSTLGSISVSEDAQGAVTVSLGGAVIASRNGYSEVMLSDAPTADYGGTTFDQLQIVTVRGANPVTVASGALGGLLKSYNQTVPEQIGSLDELARTIIDAVNTLHRSGYGQGTPPPTGIDFFLGTDAATINLDLTDTSTGAAPGSNPRTDNIAAAAGPPPPASGDNTIALAIAALLDEPQASLGGRSIAEYYGTMAARVGTSLQALDNAVVSTDMVLSQLENQREATSGVSLDEEMTNMIRYQRAFDAAAKVIATADEMFLTLLGMV
jgi:flagellar hook-associated protein 1 FlgK